jgi:hypothetical protein
MLERYQVAQCCQMDDTALSGACRSTGNRPVKVCYPVGAMMRLRLIALVLAAD